jgi:alpha-beta hydrolase superfamily lysophospholipase
MIKMKLFKTIPFLSLICLIVTPVNAQEKSGPAFTESEIVLKPVSGGEISGTLTVPGKSKKTPLVIIIAGSGPTDRDCNSPMGVKSNAYKMLAKGFADNGISTLRFDKRGIAKSKAALPSESDIRFDTYINDVVDWVDFLKQDKRFSKIILLGHSEGSLIGMIAAQKAGVSKYISVAGVGSPADKILQEQLKNQLPQQLMDESNKIIDSLKAGKTVSKVNLMLLSLYRPSVQPYMISWFRYDPAVEIKKLKIPVMIVQGTTDIQVSVDNAKLLSAAKPDARLLIIDNMNHFLKESVADRQKNLATYSDPELPLKPGLLEGIVAFIISRK